MIRMPGRTYRAPLPALSDSQRELAARLEAHVRFLAGDIGKRSTFHPRQLAEAAAYAKSRLEATGLQVRDQSFVERGTGVPNMDLTIPGAAKPGEIVLIGAHIDSFQGTPGADDNASGVAAVLELASTFAQRPQPRTLRFAIFVNEEPPSFWTPDMGSLVYAKQAKAEGDNIVAMLSLESIGYYDDTPGSQHYPPPLNLAYPSRGNFIGFVGNLGSRRLVRRCVETFRKNEPFPSEGAALPAYLPGVGWSDHWSFWQTGCEAVMVTCTATFRNPNYHKPTDTPEKVNFDRMARVVEGLEPVIQDLASRP
ncbi:MAG: M20/M25/M40 family metallo-hydrolase [Phycisphaerales bacterium]|nr:M20/M25/M40 family metallo-hydrolase [Phycisphaerales bacterium]